ncbi:CU044_5270 family protein [Nonomuraea sp. SYSU D8015]|uniref:CU044_5270 family protein n=1 Tax=Nonomuraea sp. SYSU D8015 TaxID=2593644 RepID=UPI001660C423|nr:CU044_5270 family protein [Nonomuraea sp. SYSU D8015]
MKKIDVMKVLPEARPASLRPADDPDRLARIVAAATTAPSSRNGVRARRRRLGLAWRVGIAAAAGVAVAVPLALMGTGGPSADPAARSLLLAAAEQTGRTPTGTGRYWHTRGANWGGLFSAGRTHGFCKDETWVARSPADPSWWVVHSWSRVEAAPDAPPPEEGSFDSRQAHFTCARGNRALSEQTDTTPYAGRLNDFAEPGSSWPNVNGRPVTVAELERLPSDPEALKEVLIGWQNADLSDAKRDEILFQQAAELLLELPVPAGARSALFTLLADLPQVRSLGAVRDPLGREGVGVAFRTCETRYGTETRILFDKGTGRLLSVQNAAGKQGCGDLRPRSWTAVLESGWTDETPELPGRS